MSNVIGHQDEEEASDSHSEDEGPQPLQQEEKHVQEPISRKRKRTVQFEKLYMDQLPSAAMYEKSYMHREIVTHTLASSKTDFIITASKDGRVKFWKKKPG